MKLQLTCLFLAGAVAGSAITWFARPSQQSGADAARRSSAEVQSRQKEARAAAGNPVLPAKNAEDVFLQTAAVRDFGPGGPSAADFRELLFRQPSMQRTIAFANLLSQLTPANAAEVRALIGDNATLYDLHREHELAWVRWAEIDGPAACAAIFASNSRFERTELSERTIRSWAMRDPRAAREWLLQQEDIPLRNGMMRGVLDGFAAVDPAGAQKFISEEISDASLKTHGYWRVARAHLADGGLPAVQTYFASFDKTDPQYAPMRITVADMFVDAGSPDALRWLGTLDAEGQSQVSRYVTSRLVRDKPDQLVRTLASSDTPPGIDREAITVQAVRAWVGANPNAMGDWLKENRNQPHYDEIAVPYVHQIRSVDPEAAAAWAATIKDPALRAKAEGGQ